MAVRKARPTVRSLVRGFSCKVAVLIQPDQINIAMFFFNPLKIDAIVHRTVVHVLQCTMTTRPCSTGHPVL